MSGVRDWPFVGRDALADRVEALLRADTPVVLTGTAGMGKTRLAGEVSARFAKQGVLVHRVVASPASSPVPLAPFATLVGDALGSEAVNAARKALGADGRAGAGDPVLVVDDLHLLDDASATVLQQLLAGGHVRMLATLRSSASSPAAIERVRRSAGLEHVEVGPLTDDDLVSMVEQALAAPLSGHARQLIVRSSAGNPMYARELVEGSLAARAMQRHGGVYGFEADVVATPLLEEVVLARLTPLDGHHRTALELLAVGGRLPQPLVERITGFAPLEHLERLGVVTAEEVGRAVVLDVAHPLYRELIRARLGALARMRINRTLADADALDGPLQQRSADDLLRSAMWCLRGGVALAGDLLLAAAQRAADAGDSPLAADLAEEAYRSEGSTAAALMASWCVSIVGKHDHAIHFLREALAIESDPWARAAMRLRIAEEYWWTGRLDEGHAVLDESAADPGPWNTLLDAQRGVHAMLSGDLPSAVERCQPLLAHDHPWVRFVATVGYSLAAIYSERADDGVAASMRLMSSLDGVDTGLLGDPKQHLAIQLIGLMQSGDLETAIVLSQAAYDETQRLPSLQARAWAAMLVGLASELTGSLEQATRVLAEAERMWAAVEVNGFAVWCGAGLVRAQAERGAIDEAAETLSRVETYARPGFMLNEHLLEIARAWVAVGRGDRAAAADALGTAVERTAQLGQWTNLAEAWHEAARLDLLKLMPGEMSFPDQLGRLAHARVAFVRARRAADAAAMEAAAEGLAALGALVYAAEAAAAAAVLHRRDGAAKDATRLDGLAGTLLVRAGGASTPLLASRSGAGPLSTREAEIARLASSGLTNRQVAEQLVVSERTVENHLYRVFIKLGISARDELAEALGN